jgi:hypothetical protein
MAVVVGVAAGVVEGLLSNLINLMIIFPALIGLAVGAMASREVARGHIRAPWHAAAAACLGGLVGQATVHVPAYLTFRSKLLEIAADDKKAVAATIDHEAKDPAEAAKLRHELEQTSDEDWADRALEKEAGASGIVGYLKVAASVGVHIGKVGEDPTRGINLTGAAAWGLWAVEFAIAAGIALSMARSAAREPYCEDCRRWYDPAAVFAVGSSESAHSRSVVKALRGGDHRGALGALGSPGPAGLSAISLRSCKQCNQGDSVLAFCVITTKNKKQERKDHYVALVTRDEAKPFIEHAAKEAEKPPSPSTG